MMNKKAPNTQSKVLKVRVFPTETQKKSSIKLSVLAGSFITTTCRNDANSI
jgi:hypothetical protein